MAKQSSRNAYGEALKEFGKDEKVLVLDADVSTCTMSCIFGEAYPERFFNVGIAEANMVCMAAGMATFGYKPFVHSFAMFIAGRAFEQVRNSVAYPGLNVKVVGTHAGLTVGEDGATHQCVEDISVMRTIPNMTVISPCDANETREAVKALCQYDAPAYMRIGRGETTTVTDYEEYHFEIGKAAMMKEGTDATIIATGIMVREALEAAKELALEGIHVQVMNIHTIKPIDRKAILDAANKTGAVVTAEEHNIIGGLGSAVLEVLEETKIPVVRVGVQDCFGRSGSADKLLMHYGLTAENIKNNVRKAITLK